MTQKIAKYLEAYRTLLIVQYAALVDRQQQDHDVDAGEEAKRLITEIVDIKDLVGRLGSIKGLQLILVSYSML